MSRAVITGGERGLGLALSLVLINEGFEVFSLDLVKGPSVKGKKFIKTDVSDEKQLSRSLKKVTGVDLLVNNAAIMRRGSAFESSCDDFDALFSVNVKGSWLVLKHFLPLLNKGSQVVMISSRHSSLPSNPGLYGLSKKNVELLGSLFEKEARVKEKKIKIKTAVLGPFRSDLSKIGFSDEEYAKRKNVLSKEEVAEKVFELIVGKKKKLLYDKKYFFE